MVSAYVDSYDYCVSVFEFTLFTQLWAAPYIVMCQISDCGVPNLHTKVPWEKSSLLLYKRSTKAPYTEKLLRKKAPYFYVKAPQKLLTHKSSLIWGKQGHITIKLLNELQ